MKIFPLGSAGLVFGLGVWLLVRQELYPAIGFLGVTAAVATFELLWLWYSAVGFKGAIARHSWGQFLIGTMIIGFSLWWTHKFGDPSTTVTVSMMFLSVWATSLFMNGAARLVEQLVPRRK